MSIHHQSSSCKSDDKYRPLFKVLLISVVVLKLLKLFSITRSDTSFDWLTIAEPATNGNRVYLYGYRDQVSYTLCSCVNVCNNLLNTNW